jgi:hypothetical protein
MRFSSTGATLARRNQIKKEKAIRQPRNEFNEMEILMQTRELIEIRRNSGR